MWYGFLLELLVFRGIIGAFYLLLLPKLFFEIELKPPHKEQSGEHLKK
jgi:hypothetical protein